MDLTHPKRVITDLTVLPDFIAEDVDSYFEDGTLGERVGFFAETGTDPNDYRRSVVRHWVLVGTTGMLYVDPVTELAVRVKSVHPLPAGPA